MRAEYYREAAVLGKLDTSVFRNITWWWLRKYKENSERCRFGKEYLF